MSSTQYYLAQTLDGFIAESDGGLDWLMRHHGEARIDASGTPRDAYADFFADVGALAMGSATYEFVVAHEGDRWPYEGTPTWVFTSRRLPAPDNADLRMVGGPVRPVHEEMSAAASGRNIWIVGGGELAMQFVDEDLLDELHVTVVPVFLGEGIPTFPRRLPGKLLLTGTRAFQNGMVELRYDVAR